VSAQGTGFEVRSSRVTRSLLDGSLPDLTSAARWFAFYAPLPPFYPSVGLGYGSAVVGVAPLAPLLLTPGDNSASDLTHTTFSWLFGSPLGLSEGAYAIRFMIPSTGTWTWWDAFTGQMSATEVFNSGSVQDVTVTAGLLNGYQYAWQVATLDQNGVPSPYSATSFVTGSPLPTVTITGPLGLLSEGVQLLTWINGSVVQIQSYQVIIYTPAQVAAPGFEAGQPPWVWNPGLGGPIGRPASYQLLTPLPAGTFVAYVQTTNAFGQSSLWASLDLTYSYTAPAQPTLTGTLQPSGAVSLTVTGHDTGGLVGFTYASVYRSLDGGNTWTLVPTFNGIPLPFSGQQATSVDLEPYGSQPEGALPTIYYYAVVTAPIFGSIVSPRSAALEIATGPVGTYGWVFQDVTEYSFTLEPMITALSQSQPVRGGLHSVLGDPDPQYEIDVVGSRTLKLTAVTTAVDDWLALRQMLQSAFVIYISNIYGLAGYFQLGPSGYSTEQPPGSASSTLRTTTFEMVEVATVSGTGPGT